MSLKHTTVIFDLFGTLVNVFSASLHKTAVAEMAEVLAIPLPAFATLWDDETYILRSNGTFKSIEENLAYICTLLNLPVEESQIAQAARVRYQFARLALQPKHDAIETLEQLKLHGYRTGLVSNCAPDVPMLWSTTPFASLIDVPIFSCEVGFKKPDPRIYQLVLERLHVEPEHCLYVGDGSDRELTGAKEAGMYPVLLDTLLDDAYDIHRHDVYAWDGRMVQHLKDIPDLLQ